MNQPKQNQKQKARARPAELQLELLVSVLKVLHLRSGKITLGLLGETLPCFYPTNCFFFPSAFAWNELRKLWSPLESFGDLWRPGKGVEGPNAQAPGPCLVKLLPSP